MYALSFRTDLIAQHFLVGGDWGAENQRHSHHYALELELQGHTLNQHGYLVDLLEVEAGLEEIRSRYRDQLLNDLPEFAGLNPSIEHFARILVQRLAARVGAPNLSQLRVRLWENDSASASYTQALISN